jgi:2-polyprenyl-3-methyl-5-hydroxy-6-metoxy-1,4-benzoquinol methylase
MVAIEHVQIPVLCLEEMGSVTKLVITRDETTTLAIARDDRRNARCCGAMDAVICLEILRHVSSTGETVKSLSIVVKTARVMMSITILISKSGFGLQLG